MMKKHYIISGLAILSLLIIQTFYLVNMYNEYCYHYIKTIDEQVYRAIDKETLKRVSIIYNIDYKKPVKYIALEEMTKEFRDSILKTNPLPPKPKKYNINELLEKDIILHSAELSSQRNQDDFFHKGYPLNIPCLDSLFTQNNPTPQHNFILYDSLGNSISQLNTSLREHYKYASKKFHIGIEIKQSLLLYYNIPLSGFIKSSLWSLVASVIVMLFIIYSLALQLSTIRKKRRDLDAIKKNMDGTIHDLKSPLSTLAISIQVAKSMIDSEKLQNIFSLNLLGIDNLIRGIDSILLASKNGCQVNLAQVPYHSLLQSAHSVKSNLDLLYQKKTHSIMIDNKIENNPNLFVDLYGIESVIRNLLDNALKYSGEHVAVKLNFEKSDQFIRITLSDNGWGIPNKYLKKVFRTYFRVPGNQVKQGYGIGLYQVRKIVESHHGKVFVESQMGVGTTFTVLIPAYDHRG
ncbi:MAG: ATP-binding protein [Bacteroidales bacterium]